MFAAPERFVGDGFVLRRYREDDGPALNDMVLASYEHLKRFMPWASQTVTVEESSANARRFLANYLLGTDYVVAMVAPDDHTFLGGTGFHLRHGPIEQGTAEIGMWTHIGGTGLGTRALRAMLEWGFTEWPFERLCWHCDDVNVASWRCAEKAGMRHEGTLRGTFDASTGGRRDERIYGLTKAMWLAGR